MLSATNTHMFKRSKEVPLPVRVDACPIMVDSIATSLVARCRLQLASGCLLGLHSDSGP